MKKIFCILLAYVFCHGVTSAQDFSTYFTDKTLRINYLHIGNGTEESLEIDHYTAGGIWSGTRAYLIEPNNYGDLTLEVFDSTSNKLIYSRSYSNLFIEYRTTERGKTEIDSMEECVNMPFPKNTVRLKFTSFDRNRKPTTLSISYFNSTAPKAGTSPPRPLPPPTVRSSTPSSPLPRPNSDVPTVRAARAPIPSTVRGSCTTRSTISASDSVAAHATRS